MEHDQPPLSVASGITRHVVDYPSVREEKKWEREEPSHDEPLLLFQGDCPLRCAVALTNACNSGGSGSNMVTADAAAVEVRVAVGSNARSLHLVRCVSNDSIGGRVTWGPTVCEKEYKDVHKGSVYAVDWHSTQRIVASSSNDKSVRLLR
jgi:hypothetical protein